MHMSKIITGLLFSTFFALSGCFSIDSHVLHSTGHEHVLVSNYGWTLFHTIPLISGNATPEDERLFPFALFRDDVTIDKAQEGLARYARARKKKTSTLVYRNDDKVLMSIPGLNIPVPIPYILCYHEVQLSGELE